jgi:dipeptidyl aminopeptidase/acylaminoacyl peptidase
VRVPVRAGRVFSAAHVPGRAAYLVTHVVDSATVHVGVLDPASGRVTTVGPGFLPRYADGHVVYAGLDNQLYRRPFDADRLRATGPAEAIARDIRVEDGPSFDVSRTGALIYRVGTPLTMSNGRLAITDRLGREERVLAVRAPWVPRFSRDGSRLAYGASAPGRDLSDVWVTDLDAGTTQRITTDARDNNDPQWSPDGQALAYSALAGRSGKDVVVQALDGTTRAPAPLDESDDWPSDWTPDGSAVLFTRSGEGGNQDIWVRPAAGGPPRPYLATPAREAGARVSPDGRWVAYTSNETGRDEVYVQSFPVPGRKTLVSPSGGMHPVWRGDGRELFYWQGDLLVAVEVAPAGPRAPLALRARSPLFRASYLRGAHPNYDVSPDGRRFAMVTGRARSNGIVVTLDALGGAR